MKVAVLGYGVVGVGVYEMLGRAEGLEQGPVLVRPGKADAPFKVTSIEEIVSDPTVGAVAEVMGGVEPAFTYAAAALQAGKHFVTSNKALVAARGIELKALAEEHGAAFLFSAACGGGVLRDMLAGDRPYIFVKHVYACASLAGAMLCAGLWKVLGQMAATLVCCGSVLLIRVMAARYRWRLPKANYEEEDLLC